MQKEWKEQFLESLSTSEAQKNIDYLDSSISRISRDDKEFYPLVPEVMGALMKDYKNKELCGLIQIINICESPIEIAMGLALKMQNSAFKSVEVIFDVFDSISGKLTLPKQKSLSRIIIKPQEKVLKYRVDFLITSSVLKGFTPRTYVTKKVVVECDGHDFHDKTKEQAQRDKKRDRDLQAAGCHVFRFTGSEIWGDVFRCVEEVFEFLNNLEIG